jgi:hypothetical protein
VSAYMIAVVMAVLPTPLVAPATTIFGVFK